MIQAISTQARLDKKLIHVCVFINKPTWALVLGLFDKQVEPKQKIFFVNKLVNNRARYKTCWVEDYL